MGSIMHDIFDGEATNEDGHSKEQPRSRRVSFSSDVKHVSIPASTSQSPAVSSSITRMIPIGMTERGPDSVLRILVTWVLFARRGNLGYIDEDLIVSASRSEGTNVVEQPISKLLAVTDADLKPCQARITSEFDAIFEHPEDFTLQTSLSAEATSKEIILAVRVQQQNSAFNISVQHRKSEWSIPYTELLLDILCDIFGLVSDQLDIKIEEASSTQLHETLQMWKWGSDLPDPIDRTIHSYFIEQAAKNPSKPAVVSWDGQFSYTELDCLSSKLAHKLQQMNVRPSQAVPLCFEKSAWTVLAVLAIMKAGATFVLTDPSQPEGRLATIMEEVEANVILTSTKYADLGNRVRSQASILAVGPSLLGELENLSSSPFPNVAADGLMYIIFTSGSTGKPKGVMISHSNYTSGAIPRADIVGYGPDTRVLDFASYAFDVSIDCMLLTLATGGTICVPSDDDRVNNLSGAIRKMDVNMVHTTPSIARVFEPDVIPSLKVLGLGGEAVPAHEASEWNKQTRVLVAYGPSECTVGCAFQRWEDGKSYTSLGKGCGGTLWIVDPEDHTKLSPIGASGELVVEGPIVGPGYINEPGKTAEAFVDNPEWLMNGFAGCKGRKGRLYKTGDLVKYDPDFSGAVVFVGRKDQQVKIRGQRVELEEVEYHLRKRLPPKTAVAAEVISPNGGDGMLAAFVVEHGLKQEQITDQRCTFSENFQKLLGQMSEDLLNDVPKYMVPASFIALSHIPTTVSGKTDRKQLRAIGSSLSRKQLASWRKNTVEKRQSRALSENERLLSTFWQQLLRQDADIAADDDFFALGGDSLKAMRLIALARKEKLGLTVKSIFTYPTLEAMVANATTVDTESEDTPPFSLLRQDCKVSATIEEVAELCDIVEDDVEDVYPCTPLQEGLMALSAKVSEAYVAQRVVRLPDEIAGERLKAAFDASSRDCPILRTRVIHSSEHGLLQVVVKQAANWQRSQDLEAYLANDRGTAMDLGKPLCRFALISNSDGSVDFVLTMHHALYDGWAMPLIVDRINRAYSERAVPVRTPFKNFIKWYQKQDRKASEAYWRGLLEGSASSQCPQIPHPGYQTKADSLLEKYVKVNDGASSSNTLASVIRGAWILAASHYSDVCDVVFGETLTGRNADVVGIEEIEAPLITTVPVRVQFSRDMTVTEFLERVHQQTIDRLPHEHLGLQNIRLLSKDARKACDLKTGLVLHPREEDDSSRIAEGPASALVPAGDAEAAQEALKFNSYALMLVCTLEKDGFLTMASFDSKTITISDMEGLLEMFAQNVDFLTRSKMQRLSQGPHGRVARKNTNSAIAGLGEEQQDFTRDSPRVVQEVDPALVNGVAQSWSKILKTDIGEIGKEDDFFDLGGDSIGAMKLVSELRRSGHKLTVQEIFESRRLDVMASLLTRKDTHPECKKVNNLTDKEIKPSAQPLIQPDDLKPLLCDQSWKIESVYPTRPLQEIAVRGTTKLPRYSVRYDQIYFDSEIDQGRLRKSCVDLVAQNEILRTVFVEKDGICFGVVVGGIPEIAEYTVESNLETFCQSLCELDIQTAMPYGSSFVKFFLVRSGSGKSCLLFRVSHAQYDEMCLPIMLRQLSQLYRGECPEQSLLFSSWARHITEDNIPASIKYWKEVLRGSQMQKLPGPTETVAERTKLTSLTRTVSIANRPKGVTLASFPTAAWALCLARRLQSQDVVFGEVVSGRNTGFDNAEQVTGPCWQYIPFRAQLNDQWTGLDLLKAVQAQHIASSQYEGIGLSEIVKHCTDWHADTDWFDSVLHQAVAATEKLFFDVDSSRVETCYPHLEPLREWKIQAFAESDGVTLEVITYQEWETFGRSLLEDLVVAFERLVLEPEAVIDINRSRMR